MAHKVTWDWWYPAGCIKSDTRETHEFKYDPYDGEDAAAEIVQDHIDHNDTDGATNFEIEIFEPARLAGIYDVEIELEPRAVATVRDAVEAKV